MKEPLQLPPAGDDNQTRFIRALALAMLEERPGHSFIEDILYFVGFQLDDKKITLEELAHFGE